MKKEIVDVRCKGRLRGNICAEILYQSDGEFLYILGKILNPHLREQKIVCDKCGYKMNWKRNEKFKGTKIEKNTFVEGKDLFVFELKK